MDRDHLNLLMFTCDDSLRGVRDRAILLVGHASGGRRRSELASMHMSRLRSIGSGYVYDLGLSKTNQTGKNDKKPILQSAAAALRDWLKRSEIEEGFVFRSFGKNGRLRERMSDRAIANMIKERAKQAGLDPTLYSGHSIRAGFMTQGARDKVYLMTLMELSGHTTIEVAAEYGRPIDPQNDSDADIMDED